MSHWKFKIDLYGVFHNDDLSFIERRDGVVAHLRASRWLKSLEEGDEVFDLVEELSETEGIDDFDTVWGALYEYADNDRVWINTLFAPRTSA